MTTILTVLSLAVAAYRIKKGLFTRLEWFLLCLWLGHFALEEAQLLVKFHHFRYDPRYFRPASFLSWIVHAGIVSSLRFCFFNFIHKPFQTIG